MNIRQARHGSLNFNLRSHIAMLGGCQNLVHYPALGSIALNDSSRASNGFPCYISAVRSMKGEREEGRATNRMPHVLLYWMTLPPVIFDTTLQRKLPMFLERLTPFASAQQLFRF